MNLLLDTHILLWWLADDPRLPRQAQWVVTDPDTAVYVSAATVWEMAVKRSLGRLEVPDGLTEVLEVHRFAPLAISFDHAVAAGALPHHHRDPFDRMLIAQAQVESLTVVSVDAAFSAYAVDLLPV